MQALRSDCVACNGDGHYTVLLAVGPSTDDENARYFIPNQHVREEHGSGMDPTRQITFCRSCMRTVEDNLRGTIASLQQKHGVPPVPYSHY
jgi:hypothetical protein